MADDKLSRFRHLERTRRETSAPAAQSPGSGRFDALEQPAESPVAQKTPAASTARFREPAAPEQVELARVAPDDQPFVRCAQCEGDNHAFATVCGQCGADLATAEQRAFNERLWAGRRAEREQEQKQLQQMAEQRARDAEELGAEKRAMAVELARNVAEQTRRRLDEDGVFGPRVNPLRAIPREFQVIAVWAAFCAGGLLLVITRTRPIGVAVLTLGALLWLTSWLKR